MKHDLWLKACLFSLVILIAVAVRFYKIDNSIAEWFSWRQSDTAAVGKIYVEEGIDLFHPRYYDLSNIQSGKDNPQGLRYVEFPLYSATFAILARQFTSVSLEVWARIVTIVSSLIIISILFHVLNKEYGLAEAFFGSLFFATAPYIVFYSRAVLPDMPAVALAMISIFFMYRSLQKGWIAIILSAVFMALALLVKPTVIYFAIIPMYLVFRRPFANKFHLFPAIGIFLSIAAIPFGLWRLFISQFPEGIPANQWLFTMVNTSEGLKNIFFRPAFFRWIFFERISHMILGGYMLFFVILSFFNVEKNKLKLHILFIVSGLLYLFTFQGGNVQHDYYQIMITPMLAVLVGVGVGWFLKQRKWGLLAFRFAVVLVIFGMSIFFSYNQISGYYNQSEDLVLIAEVIDSFTNKNDIIVTDTEGDTTLLYLSSRRGYPAPYREFAELKKQGAKYFATQALSYKPKLIKTYKLLFENDKVLLFAL
ncbi:MAG: glycosyltransferase family 39 protein [Patescibacteria group bacterium]|jgi:hypothetical protein